MTTENDGASVSLAKGSIQLPRLILSGLPAAVLSAPGPQADLRRLVHMLSPIEQWTIHAKSEAVAVQLVDAAAASIVARQINGYEFYGRSITASVGTVSI